MPKNRKEDSKEKKELPRLYSRTVDESELGNLIDNTTGYKNRKLNYSLSFTIDPRSVGLEPNSDYIRGTKMFARFQEDSQGNIKALDVQLVEKSKQGIEDVFGRRLFNNEAINGTADMETYNLAFYSNPKSKYAAFTTVSGNTAEIGTLNMSRVNLNRAPIRQVDVSINMDAVSKDYLVTRQLNGIETDQSHYVKNTNNGTPVEIDPSIAELFSFYRKAEYEKYVSIMKMQDKDFKGLNSENFHTSITNYELSKISGMFASYLTKDTAIFQSKGEQVDIEGYLKTLKSADAEALTDSINNAINLYKSYSRTFNLHIEDERMNYGNIAEVRRAVMTNADKIITNEDFLRSVDKIMKDLDEKVNVSMKSEVENRLSELKQGPNFTESKAMIMDLEYRNLSLDKNLNYLNSLKEWSDFSPEISNKLISKFTSDGRFDYESAKREALSDITIVDAQNLLYKSRGELDIMWNNLNRQIKILMPDESLKVGIDEEKAINIRNIAKSMEIIKEVALNHPDSNNFKVNPYVVNSVDKLIVDISTKNRVEKLIAVGMSNSQDRVNGNVIRNLDFSTLESRDKTFQLIKDLSNENARFDLSASNKSINYNSLIKDSVVVSSISDISANIHKMSMNELNAEVEKISQKIMETNRQRITDALSNPSEVGTIKEELGTKAEILRTVVKNQIMIKVLESHIDSNNYNLNIEKNMEFIALNNRTRIAEYMNSNSEAMLKIYKSHNPGMSNDVVLHDNAVGHIKSHLANSLNISSAEMDFISSSNGDFFKGSNFEKLIFENKDISVRYSTFESVSGIKDLKRDLQDPEKCRDAYANIMYQIKEVEKLDTRGEFTYSPAGTMGGIMNDGSKTILQEYKQFIENHIIENKMNQQLAALSILNLDKDTHLSINLNQKEKSEILAGEFSSEIKENLNSPKVYLRELKLMEAVGEKDSHEYKIIKDNLEKSDIKFKHDESFFEITEALNKKLFTEFISDNMTSKLNETELDKLKSQFEDSTGIKVSTSLKEIDLSEIAKIKAESELVRVLKDNPLIDINAAKDIAFETSVLGVNAKEVKAAINNVEFSKEELLTKVNYSDLVGKLDNPKYVVAASELISDSSFTNSLKDYMSEQKEAVKDDILKQNIKLNLVEAGLIDSKIYEQAVRDTAMELKTSLVQGSIKTQAVDGQMIYVVDDAVHSKFKADTINLDRMFSENITAVNKSVNIGSVDGVMDKRAEHGTTTVLASKIDELKDIYANMDSRGYAVSMTNKVYDSAGKGNDLDYLISKKISSNQELSSEIISIERKLQDSPVYEKIPNTAILISNMESIQREITLEKVRLEELNSKYDFDVNGGDLANRFKLTLASFKDKESIDINRNDIYDTSAKIEYLQSKYSELAKSETLSIDKARVIEDNINEHSEKIIEAMTQAKQILKITPEDINLIIDDYSTGKLKSEFKINTDYPIMDKQNLNEIFFDGRDPVLMNRDEVEQVINAISYIQKNRIDNSNDFSEQQEYFKVAQGYEIMSSYDTLKNFDSFAILDNYKSKLEEIADVRSSLMSQEYVSVIEQKLGHYQDVSADIAKLNQIFENCEKSYIEIESLSTKIKSLNISLNEGNSSPAAVMQSVSELFEAINKHNKNVVEMHDRLSASDGQEYLKGLNSSIIGEASSTLETRKNILKELHGESIDVNYGHDIFNSPATRPATIESVVTHMKLEDIKDEIMLYHKDLHTVREEVVITENGMMLWLEGGNEKAYSVDEVEKDRLEEEKGSKIESYDENGMFIPDTSELDDGEVFEVF